MCAIGLCLSLGIPGAEAHAQLVETIPKSNAKVQVLPEKVRIEFDGNLITIGDERTNLIIVRDSQGNQIDQNDSIVGGARLTISLKPVRTTGRIHVNYRVVSEDGHPIEGDYFFTVVGSVSAKAVTTPAAKKTITCIKTKKKIKVTAMNPRCASGWRMI
jgi:methionine-rich copper-binding protein CopC